jgi:hypothetical protein
LVEIFDLEYIEFVLIFVLIIFLESNVFVVNSFKTAEEDDMISFEIIV